MSRSIKQIMIVAMCFVGVASTYAQGTVEITISNIKSDEGELRVGLFNQRDFLKEVVEGKIVKPLGNSVTVVFENVKPGVYAISVLHDENGNGVLDRTRLGIPKEGFAFGNNAMGKKGPPTFDQAKIEVTNKPVTHALKMKYF
ncbi:MAG: DUF2141 domain-containing protein [Chryseolinea sp.]